MAAETVALYDDSRVHDIDVTFDKAAYDEMVAAGASNRDKDWIEATVMIDGVTVENLAPLIEFLEFINASSDAAFAADRPRSSPRCRGT